MPDIVDPATRSRIMAGIQATDVGPECRFAATSMPAVFGIASTNAACYVDPSLY
jgi:G:T-mismatch repair DNA endonuclease (very short patch repair protein)